MATEQIVNQQTSFINMAAGLAPGVTALTILDATGWPVPGLHYRISIDSEVMLVTALAGSVLTVVRGQEGTVDGAHINGSAVVTAVTAGALYAVFVPQ